MKRIFTFCIALMITLALCSCGYSGYRGEHTDLYTVAAHNIFCTFGYINEGEISSDPIIHIVETDDYGRTLFFYNEYSSSQWDSGPGYGIAFVIMQKSADGYAYYYRDRCYLPYYGTSDDWENIWNRTDPAKLEALKADNDWNQEFREEKCAKLRITNEKSEGTLKPRRYELDKYIYPAAVSCGYTGQDRRICKWSQYCETDSYGRELHYVWAITHYVAENGETVYVYWEFAIILQADGSCLENGVVWLENIEDTLSLVNELKADNGWDQQG